MNSRYLLILASGLLLTSCAPNNKDADPLASETSNATLTAAPTETPAADSPSTPAADKKTLDLSMPENFFPENSEHDEVTQPDKFDAGSLFKDNDKKTLNVKVRPSLKPGAQPNTLPEIDGGSVDIELNTK